MPDWFIISKYFQIGGLVSLWPRGFIIFHGRIPKYLLSDCNATSSCEDKKIR